MYDNLYPECETCNGEHCNRAECPGYIAAFDRAEDMYIERQRESQ